MRSFTLLALTGLATASPAVTPVVNIPAAFCSVVTKGISAASQQATATSFCSSFLSIPLKTSTVTATVYTSTFTSVSTTTTTTQVVTAPVVTDVVTSSTTSFTTTTFTDTSTTTTSTTQVLATSTVSSCVDPKNVPQKMKRALLSTPIAKPTALAAYAAGAPISSACSCLSITPSTTTVTTTTSLVKTVSSTTSVGTITTTTPHTTSTSVSTITSLVSTTTTSWSSVLATQTTGTTTIAAVPTFKIEIIGGDKDGRWAHTGGSIVAMDGANSYATSFTLSGTNLVATDGNDAGEIANENSEQNPGDTEIVQFSSASDIAAAGDNSDVLSCSIAVNSDGTCPLTCVVNGGTNNFDCGTYWRIQQAGGNQYCSNTFLTYAVTN